MEIRNRISEVEEDLKNIKGLKCKVEYLDEQYHQRLYLLKKGLTVTYITDQKTEETGIGLHLFEKEVIDRSIEMDEVLAFCRLELEYISRLYARELQDSDNQGIHCKMGTGKDNDSNVRQKIWGFFDAIDKEKKWGYAFRNINDFTTFVDLLQSFFDRKTYEVPKNLIILRSRTQTRVARTLREIVQELSPSTLRNNDDLFRIVRVLSPFAEMSNEQIYRALTR